ncbi:hypothetical protein Phou_020440 [Phytohabitans houttuyneae]|uniref:Uncharacterized protein n=1 Tax=Phytohabitans houttuyneae TaxID=1076126 RepID=A0A6V8K2D6_9ACTN|nr:hypothetical protein Phou_020440 [Phytohabitans houttuyneae]
MQEQVALGRVEHVDGVQRRVGGGREDVQRPREPGGEALAGRRVEEVGGDGQHAAQPGRTALAVEGLGGHDVEVELRRCQLGRVDCRQAALLADAGQVERGVLHVLDRGEHDLEERVAGEGADRRELFHEPFEGDVLVRHRAQRRRAHPGQHRAEGRIPGQVGADHERVGEEADEVVHRLVGATGDRRADRDVGSRAEAG